MFFYEEIAGVITFLFGREKTLTEKEQKANGMRGGIFSSIFISLSAMERNMIPLGVTRLERSHSIIPLVLASL